MDRLALWTGAPIEVGVELLYRGGLRLPIAFHADPPGIHAAFAEERVALQTVPLEFVPPVDERRLQDDKRQGAVDQRNRDVDLVRVIHVPPAIILRQMVRGSRRDKAKRFAWLHDVHNIGPTAR